MDVAYSPAGYNVVASAVSMGAGLNLGLRVTVGGLRMLGNAMHPVVGRSHG